MNEYATGPITTLLTDSNCDCLQRGEWLNGDEDYISPGDTTGA